MTDYKIISDSTADLPLDLIEELDVHIIPMLFTVDGSDYLDSPYDPQLPTHDFYELLRAGKMSNTTQINIETFKDEFIPFLEKGLDILYICFSSGLSSTYNSALIAATDLKEQFPERKIIVVDSLAASMGEGLLVYHAAMLQKGGSSLEQTAAWVEENRLLLAHWFTVEDLNFLKRGGRVSGAAALVGTVLSIKPVLHVDDEGHLVPVEKLRGRRNSLAALVSHMEKTATDPGEQVVFISHADSLADAEYVEKLVREKFGVETVYINYIGPIIGTHAGPGTIALFFLAKNK
ncbi:MAG: DegV family protein [Oscillospiraceae bacterium]|jgi:DegV family protein with EDD domain|nr:DegV family protein [Oscillospiraceae bacterium]